MCKTTFSLVFIFFIEKVVGTKNSAVYSMRGTLQYRFTTARVQWPCSTDIHWACLITQSGPARYVTRKRLRFAIVWSNVEIKLRVRDAGSWYVRRPKLQQETQLRAEDGKIGH